MPSEPVLDVTACPKLRWYQGVKPYQWWVFAIAAFAWLFDCADQRIFMLARLPRLADLLHVKQTDPIVITYGTYATAATMIGWAVGGLFFGVVGDRWGRTRTLAVSILVYSLFTGLCGLATNWWDFCLYRFLMGGGIGGAFATAATLVAETMPEHSRAVCMGLFSALSLFGNMTGSALAGWLFPPAQKFFESGIAGWRLLFFVGMLPALLIVFIMRTVRESEQWLAARKTASENIERQMGDVGAMFTHPRWRRSTIIAVGLATAGIVGVWGVSFWSPELMNYALGPKVPKEGLDRIKAGATLLQDFGGFLGIVVFTFLANHTGRRANFAVAFICSFAIITYVFLKLDSVWEAYVLLPILGFFTISVMGGLVIYLPELYPTRCSTGTAFGYNVARLSSAAFMLLGDSIQSSLRRAGVTSPFRVGAVLLSSIYLLGLVLILWAPETKNQPLPEED